MRREPIHAQLTLRRRFHAPREVVFRAWTDPNMLERWFASREGVTTSVAEVDLRAGGAFRIVVMGQAGGSRRIRGTYLEVHPPERLVFTWKTDGSPLEPDEGLVTLEFLEMDGEVEIVLTHARLSGDEAVESQATDCTEVLDDFDRYVTRLL